MTKIVILAVITISLKKKISQILIGFGRMVWNDKRKVKFNIQKNQSKVKIKEVKKALKMTVFKLFPLYLLKFLADFDEIWQDIDEYVFRISLPL